MKTPNTHSMKEQINKILLSKNLNSETTVQELQRLNTSIAESEMNLPQIKHLPTTLRLTLENLLEEIK